MPRSGRLSSLLGDPLVTCLWGAPRGSSQIPIDRRAHRRASNASDQMVSALVARRSKRPAYPLSTLCVFRATPKKGITTIGRRPQATQKATQPRQGGHLQKQPATTNKPKGKASTITLTQTAG